MFLFLLICLTLLNLTTSVDYSDPTIDDGVPVNFTITIDSSWPGSDQEVNDLTTTLYWKTNFTQGAANIISYRCIIAPDGTASDKDYVCDSTNWGTPTVEGLPDTSAILVPYGMKLEFDHPSDVDPVAIKKIVVQLDNGYIYTIDTFCIHSNMACSFGLGAPNGECGYWRSKDEYNTVKIGDATNFKILYIDFRFDITSTPNFENIIHEGSVRPPTLTQFAITVGSPNTAIQSVSAQWDNVIYKCSSNPAMDATEVTCTPDQFLLCPSLKSSFWVSFENTATIASAIIWFTSAIITDETNNVFTMSQLCHENDKDVGGFYTTSHGVNNCSSLDQYFNVIAQWGALPIGGNDAGFPTATFYPNFEAFVAPNWAGDPLIETQDCIFNYPNDANNGLEIVIVNADTKQGWGDNLYGGTDAFQCPVTEQPTQYPTYIPTHIPTFDPTIDPTSDPTFEPTFVPTFIPTFIPTHIPTNDPTNDPTYDPTSDPTSDPTHDPTLEPTYDPTNDPTIEPTKIPSSPPTTGEPSIPPTKNPSKFPTKTPTKFPTSGSFEEPETTAGKKLITKTNIFWAILALVLFLLCCFICVIFIYWKRNKEDEEEENKAAPMVAAAANATHHKEDTYGAYDAGAINTQPSMLDDDEQYNDNFGGQYEAKEEIELEEVKEEEIDTQPTLDGHSGATGGTAFDKGDDKVLDILADGHETGGTVKKTDSEINPQETFAEFTV